MTEKFKGSYQVDDGYCGGSRPQSFTISADEIEDDMDDKDLENLYYEEMQDHFVQNISPVSDQVSEFIEWAKEQMAARADEE